VDLDRITRPLRQVSPAQALLTQLPTVAIVPRRVAAMVDAVEKVTASDAVRGALTSASTAPHASHRMYES
jgi:hypothetical protein